MHVAVNQTKNSVDLSHAFQLRRHPNCVTFFVVVVMIKMQRNSKELYRGLMSVIRVCCFDFPVLAEMN